MSSILYLISCEDREESDMGLMRDSRNTSERLQKILRRYFEDESIKVLSLEIQGKEVCGRFEAKCVDGEGDEFTVQLEKTDVWEI